MNLRILAAIGVSFAVAGCSGSSTDAVGSVQGNYDALQAEVSSLRDIVEPLDRTVLADVPVSGSATYTGVAIITFDADPRGLGLIGDARITADFNSDMLRGQLSGFYGAVSGDTVSSFDGALSVTDGRIDVTQDEQLSAQVSGTLTSGSDVIVVDNALRGELRGEPRLIGEAPEGLILESPSSTTFDVNGSQSAGAIEVIAVD